MKNKFRIRRIRKSRKMPSRKLAPKFSKWLNFSPKDIQVIKVVGLALLTVALMVLVYFGQKGGIWFKASILEAPQPFNGTVMPVAKVPDWTHWMNGQPDMTIHYDSIPNGALVDLPPYDLGKMQFPDDKLVWGDESQTSIRNTKITYPTVYLGDYEFDHQEGAGSHLGVDIKMPVGTPIHAIANGKVIKVSNQSSGFGHHVVIEHQNMPDPDNPGQRTTLYSAFNHMDRIDVVEGQNLLKGQVIGTSGNTGTSTTPHLHFQIDRDSAPWHPYWPFSSAESSAAGLSFFQAVNAGLGMDKAKTTTVNPMKLVITYMGAYSVASSNETSVPQNTTPQNPTSSDQSAAADDQPTASNSNPPTPIANPPSTDTSGASLFEYKITGESVSLVGSAVTLIATDEKNQISKLSDDDTLRAEIEGQGNLLRKVFKKSDFVNNTLKLIVKSDVPGAANIMLGKSAYQVNFVNAVSPVSSFRIEHDGSFQRNIVEKVRVIALDNSGNLAPAVNFTGAVEVKVTQGEAEVTPHSLQSSDFQSGSATIKVVSSSDKPIVLRAQNGALVGVSEPLRPEDTMVFTDIKPDHPNYTAIKYLKDQGIVSGYKDGTFKPDQTVNRAEALKMLMTAFNIGTASNSAPNFKDVDSGAWYIQALAVAVDKDIVNGYKDGTFKPSNIVNRAEYLKILFKTTNVEPAGEIAKPYKDVQLTDWFAPYAYLANKMNLLRPADNFNPSNGMTRAGVAETIYRMRMIQTNNWVTYSK